MINRLNKMLNRARGALGGRTGIECRTISREEHGIRQTGISRNALKVIDRLVEGGFSAYIVGGGVRDLLLGHEPKDFDVATDALPDEVRRLFRNCRLIGRRFRLAHIHFGRDIVEVATFRANTDDGQGERRLEDGRLVRDNVYGGIEDDALRRDFTINALYYDPRAGEVLDFTGGYADLKQGLLRLIGAPERRFREDPVRMLRAARFCAKLGFRLDADIERLIPEMGGLLRDISPARLYDEILKLFLTGHALPSFEQLRHLRLFEHLFPDTDASLEGEDEGYPRTLISRAMANTDQRVGRGKPVIPAFLFAALLWDPVRLRADRLMEQDVNEREALEQAAEWLMARQVKCTAIPKRTSWPMREIWFLQPRFRRRHGKGALRLLGHPRFRAAYDFLLLRAETDDSLKESARWWTEMQEKSEPAQRRETLGGKKKKRRRRRKRKTEARD